MKRPISWWTFVWRLSFIPLTHNTLGLEVGAAQAGAEAEAPEAAATGVDGARY